MNLPLQISYKQYVRLRQRCAGRLQWVCNQLKRSRNKVTNWQSCSFGEGSLAWHQRRDEYRAHDPQHHDSGGGGKNMQRGRKGLHVRPKDTLHKRRANVLAAR